MPERRDIPEQTHDFKVEVPEGSVDSLNTEQVNDAIEPQEEDPATRDNRTQAIKQEISGIEQVLGRKLTSESISQIEQNNRVTLDDDAVSGEPPTGESRIAREQARPDAQFDREREVRIELQRIEPVLDAMDKVFRILQDRSDQRLTDFFPEDSESLRRAANQLKQVGEESRPSFEDYAAAMDRLAGLVDQINMIQRNGPINEDTDSLGDLVRALRDLKINSDECLSAVHVPTGEEQNHVKISVGRFKDATSGALARVERKYRALTN